MNKKIIILDEVGFCSGVINSISKAENQVDGTMIGNIVNNLDVTSDLLKKGLKIIDFSELEKQLPYHNRYIISAHGLSSSKQIKIFNLNKEIVDTTCPIVRETHNKIKHYLDDNYTLIYFCKKNHREARVIIDDYEKVYVVENIEDVSRLTIDSDKIVLACLTTSSPVTYGHIKESVLAKWPNTIVLDTICPVTIRRQNKLRSAIETYSFTKPLIIVVGDATSNNTRILFDIASKELGQSAVKIENFTQLDEEYLKKYNTFILCSGTSTPVDTVLEVKKYIERTLKI